MLKKKRFLPNWNIAVLLGSSRFRKSLKSFVILTPLLGLTWVFGLLAVTDAGLVFQYIFTILNSTQVCIQWFTAWVAVSKTEQFAVWSYWVYFAAFLNPNEDYVLLECARFKINLNRFIILFSILAFLHKSEIYID